MKRRLPRKIKKAASNIRVISILKVKKENFPWSIGEAILDYKVESKTKTGRMTCTMYSVIRKRIERDKGVLALCNIAATRGDFKHLMNGGRPLIIESGNPDTTSWVKSLIPEPEVKEIKFDNGVTMKFVPYYDPETGKTY